MNLANFKFLCQKNVHGLAAPCPNDYDYETSHVNVCGSTWQRLYNECRSSPEFTRHQGHKNEVTCLAELQGS